MIPTRVEFKKEVEKPGNSAHRAEGIKAWHVRITTMKLWRI